MSTTPRMAPIAMPPFAPAVRPVFPCGLVDVLGRIDVDAASVGDVGRDAESVVVIVRVWPEDGVCVEELDETLEVTVWVTMMTEGVRPGSDVSGVM